MKRIVYLLAVTVLLASVTISCKTKVTSVALNKTELTLSVGNTEPLIATVLPDDASNKAVSWKSNNPAVATVDNGKIVAKTEGITTITVISIDGNKTASCTVIVIAPIEEPEMIFVEGGTFMYGLNDEEFKEWAEMTGWEEGNELDWGVCYPQVQKTVSSFYIAKYPVTQKLWKQVMGTFPNEFIDSDYGKGDNYPIYYVRFLDVVEFIKKINIYTGKNYRLLSFVEWEYAAKGGNKSKGYKYSGSNNLDEVAWCDNISHPVGEKLPNELGIYDMTGNVAEWTYGMSTTYVPSQKTQGELIRGNCWFVSFASWQIVYYCNYYNGFRLALSE